MGGFRLFTLWIFLIFLVLNVCVSGQKTEAETETESSQPLIASEGGSSSAFEITATTETEIETDTEASTERNRERENEKFVEKIKEVEVTSVYLYKCAGTPTESETSAGNGDGDEDGADVTEDFLVLPEILQIPYISEKFTYFKNKYGRTDLFNFTLKENPRSMEEKCAGSLRKNSNSKAGSGSASNSYSVFSLNISKVMGYEMNPHFNFTPDGYLGYYKSIVLDESVLNETGGVALRREELFYHPENYCISKITDEFITVQVCKSECHTEEKELGAGSCIPKCCTMGQVMTSGGCVDTIGDDWDPTVYVDPKTDANSSRSAIHPNFYLNYVNFHWSCTTNLLQSGHTNEELRFFANGRLYVKDKHTSPWIPISPGGDFRKYCADGFWDPLKEEEWNMENIVMSCKKELFEKKEVEEKLLMIAWTYPQILFAVTLISSLIHLCTVSVYLILIKSQNVHGWTILCFSACQLLLNVLLAGHFGAFSFSASTKELGFGHSLNSLCVTYGILHQFLLISSFSWSTALTFDAWAKIQSMTPTSRNYKGKKRFAAYCLFGFGTPLVIVIISIVVEFTTGGPAQVEYAEFPDFSVVINPLENATSEIVHDYWIRPKYKETCIILGGLPYILYIGLPIVSFLGVNMIFALLTVKVLWDAKKNVQSFKDSSTSASIQNQAKLVGKLFILMGAFLLFEILLTFWTPVFTWVGFAFVDFYRIFNAAALFWILVCNKNIPKQLAEKFPSVKRYINTPKKDQTTFSTAVSTAQS